MKTWRVTYEHLGNKAAGRPFWKLEERVQAVSRSEAIRQIKEVFSPPVYGNYKASVVK